MCIDDYQFRHCSAIKLKQCRRFIFINEDDIQKTFLVNISQFQEDGQVALCRIFNHLSSKGLCAEGRTFFWPKFNFMIKYGDKCKVPFETLEEKEQIFRTFATGEEQKDSRNQQRFSDSDCFEVETCLKKEETNVDEKDSNYWNDGESCENSLNYFIKNQEKARVSYGSNIHYEQQQRVLEGNNEEKKIEENGSKRSKQSERLILQVLIALKNWRKLYENKKLNLTKAAKVIGISKKSLDDYFLIVRIGEIHGFDFESHLGGKMGDLRSYIKRFEYKVVGKLTKKVRCFRLIPQVDIDSLIKSYNQLPQQTNQLIKVNQNKL